jgi:dephospho-CoA kinase
MLSDSEFTKLLFSDEVARQKMNSFVHPFVRDEYYKLCEWSSDYVLFESAILFDGKERIETDYNILVLADMKIRIKRVQERNLMSVEDVMKRINSQTSDDYKIQFTDFLITNNGDEKKLDEQIVKIHNKILSL